MGGRIDGPLDSPGCVHVCQYRVVFFFSLVFVSVRTAVSVEYPSRLLRHPVTLVTSIYRAAGTNASAEGAELERARVERFLNASEAAPPLVVATSPDLFAALAAMRYARCTTPAQRRAWTPALVRRIEASVSRLNSAVQRSAVQHARALTKRQTQHCDRPGASGIAV